MLTDIALEFAKLHADIMSLAGSRNRISCRYFTKKM
jgi:hypothetical protein